LMSPFILGGISGKLFDSGHFHAIEIVGGAIFIFSIFMLSLAKPLQPGCLIHLFSQGVGVGIGLGFTFVPTASIAVHHFSKQRGLASGVALSGASVGGTVFPIIPFLQTSLILRCSHLIPKLGFGPAVRATGYVVLGCIVAGNALMRTRFLPHSKRDNVVGPNIKSFFSDAPYMWAVVGYLPVIYMQLFGLQHSVGSSLAFYSIAIMNGSGAVGRVVGNHLADVYGPLNVQVCCTFVTGALMWAVLGINAPWSLILVSVLCGIFSGEGLRLALEIICLSSFARTPDEVGARTGVAVALTSIGSLASAPIQGALLTSHFIWIRPAAFSGVSQHLICPSH
ncbi:major facilitator superfamily domain-containing protein, partial [Mycena rosella]